VSEPELQGFKIGRTRLKPACGCEEAPIFFKESKPVLEVLFRRKNPTALVWFGAVNLYKIHKCLHKTPRAMTCRFVHCEILLLEASELVVIDTSNSTITRDRKFAILQGGWDLASTQSE
jgi:hypothetical protein